LHHNNTTLGNGNNDTVFSGGFDTVTVGNGNDTVHVGTNDTVTVGTGHDVLAFDWNPQSAVSPLDQGPDQSKPGGIGVVTITGFDATKDVIVLQQTLATDFSHLNFQDVSGNTVVTIQGDTLDQITLVGVHSSALHASDFQFV
jgi:Ca2+-binding RTX toxin-like protein